MTVYALLVGINAYSHPLKPLQGSLNDIERAGRYLATRVRGEGSLKLKELCDADATRSAVIDGFRVHLGQAGRGDAALFWFSGHGSQAPVPPLLAHLEPSGMLQSVVCADSRRDGVTDLFDKEIAILVARIAARGAHIVLVMDCCNADGTTRLAPTPHGAAPPSADDLIPPALTARRVPALADPPALDRLLTELADPVRAARYFAAVSARHRRPDHVALAACHAHQSAYEFPFADGRRGVFSHALIEQLEQLGPGSSYRSLMTGARCYVEGRYPAQLPVLYPAADTLADQPFLGGNLKPPASPLTMYWADAKWRWEMDAGACHGIDPGTPDDRTRVAVATEGPLREASVVEVLADRSVIEPADGWTPDRSAHHPVVVSAVPVPAVAVAVGGGPGDDPATAALIARAINTAAPNHGPSPHLRLVSAHDLIAPPELYVSSPHPGSVCIRDAAGHQLAPSAPCTSHTDALAVTSDLEHIARWRRIRDLSNPAPRLEGAVRIEIVSALSGETVDPRGRDPLSAGADGALTLAYRHIRRTPGDDVWLPPRVFIRLRNTSPRRLYCALLDLTDRFKIFTGLFPGDWVGAGYTANAAAGAPVEFTLPRGRAVRPGAEVTDWLKLLICEEPFSSTPFALPALGGPARPGATGRGVFSGTLDRLGLTVLSRDAEVKGAAARDWASAVLPVVTRVP
ncbi:MAG TPA: caspase family protein [Actinocrinis sp.]|nr:caspase family protein [Actinocrinis sp.]